MTTRLTPQQLEAANKILYRCWARALSAEALEELAAVLQIPQEMPSEAENAQYWDDYRDCDGQELDRHARAMNDFVERRNAALQPKPPDPERERMRGTIACAYRQSYVQRTGRTPDEEDVQAYVTATLDAIRKEKP